MIVSYLLIKRGQRIEFNDNTDTMNQSILFALLAVLLFTNCFVQSAPRSYKPYEESNKAVDKRGISSFTEFLQGRRLCSTSVRNVDVIVTYLRACGEDAKWVR